MSDLVKRLSEGLHPVEISCRPERTLEALREQVDRQYVLVKFTETRGGTELGVPIDPAYSDFSQVDFEGGTGRMRVAGKITLNYVPVRVVAEVELPGMKGQGRVEVVERKGT